MRVEIKQMWLDALRSGEYKQGQGALHIDHSFCCLGVLCDLHRKNSINRLDWEFNRRDNRFEYEGEAGELPNIINDWAGINNIQKLIFSKLINCNDSGSTFAEIADIIEAEL